MIVTVIRIDKERVTVDIAFGSVDVTVPCLASEKVAADIVPENTVADIRL